MSMGYSDVIAREAETLPAEKQAEVLDFIAFLKQRQVHPITLSVPKTVDEIEAFFHSFNVDVSGYTFDREEANAR
jgi:hypothetical protein